MQRVKAGRIWRSGIRAIPGTFLVGLVTALCYALRLDLTVTGFLYLIIVVLQSLIGDFVSSAVVSIIADLCLNFFFAPPFFSFRVSDSSDFWALIAFLITGLVITRLTTKVRREMQISELHRRDTKLLYELSQRLFALDPREGNLWGTQAASSPEKAKTLFREKVKGWHSPSSRLGHLQSMEEDRARRLRDDDFDVELA